MLWISVNGYVGIVHEALIMERTSDWPDEPSPGPKNSKGLPTITINRKVTLDDRIWQPV